MSAALRQQLMGLNVGIQLQIDVLQQEAKEKGISTYDLRLADGSYPLIPLLLAKAQVLNGLAVLSKKS